MLYNPLFHLNLEFKFQFFRIISIGKKSVQHLDFDVHEMFQIESKLDVLQSRIRKEHQLENLLGNYENF